MFDLKSQKEAYHTSSDLTIWTAGETSLSLDHQTLVEEGWEGEQLSCHSNDLCTEEDIGYNTVL